MSSNFINYTAVPYAGSMQGQSVGVCTPSTYNPRVVPIVIDWDKYPTNAVTVDMGSSGIINPIDFIRSIVIDNQGQPGSIAVNFPDTNFTIDVAPDTTVSGFALTFQLKLRIFRGGNPPSGGITTIYVCNFLVDTYVQESLAATIALWAGTSTSPGNATYGPPALGTQHDVILLSLTGAGSALLFGGPRLSGTIRVTGLTMTTFGCYSDTNLRFMQVYINQVGLGTKWGANFYARPDLSEFSGKEVLRQMEIQVPLDARQSYQYINAGQFASQGACQLDIYWDWLG